MKIELKAFNGLVRFEPAIVVSPVKKNGKTTSSRPKSNGTTTRKIPIQPKIR